MIKTILARDNLMVGYGRLADQTPASQLEVGCRPSVFYGPRRDAESLITRKIYTALIVKPRKLVDMSGRVYVLGLPSGDGTTPSLWQEQLKQLSGNLSRKACWVPMNQTASELETQADIYRQTFIAESSQVHDRDLLPDVKVTTEAFISDSTFRETINLEGLDAADWQCWVLHWHEPEIAVSNKINSTGVDFNSSRLYSWRGNVFFGVQGYQESLAPVSWAEAGWRQHNAGTDQRFGDIVQSIAEMDVLLGFQYQSNNKKVFRIPLEERGKVSHGNSDGMILWQYDCSSPFEIRYSVASNHDELLSQEWEPVNTSRNQVRIKDQEWLAKQKPAPAGASANLKKKYDRTLLVLRQMQDPSGGIIAAPEFDYNFINCGGYGYCWGRDAGFISYAMDICGMHKESAEFYRYMARCQSADGSFLHRHDMNGKLGSSWGLLQPDETGSVLFGLSQHIKLGGDSAIADELKDMITKGADWLAQSRYKDGSPLPISGHDLWEEREGIHFYAIGAMIAGLEAALFICDQRGWEKPALWTKRTQELKEILNSEVFIRQQEGKPAFVRTLKRRIDGASRARFEDQGQGVETYVNQDGRNEYRLEADFVVDVAQLGAFYPYEVLDLEQNGDALDSLIQQVRDQLWRPGGGVGRYEGDFYREGNPWVLATMWLGLAASKRGRKDLASECWDWVMTHIPEEGLIPEQVNPETGKPAWVMPLTWSHAMFALGVHQFPATVLGND